MTADRYIIEYVGGKDILAVYVVYISIAMAINSILVPTVFSFVYPKLVANYKKGKFAEYQRNLKELIRSVVIIGGGVAVLIGVLAGGLPHPNWTAAIVAAKEPAHKYRRDGRLPIPYCRPQ